ncbi:helix-turn-helix domain-containing protein [Devosia sp.]|uniref:helix-turn-helix domain-containing protein n=1 Tax=Devosia sp. TaxID=1871048 RepID=UPI003F723332
MSIPLKVRFGLNVRAARSQRGLTQAKLAKRARVSGRYLREIEHGRANVRLPVVERIAAALWRTPGELIAPR